ncbi:alginate export family protein [Bacteroidota bacterium]
MTKFFSHFLVLGVFLLLANNILAQSVKISAEIRPRYEFRHGYKTLIPDDVKPANFISQRTRLNAYFANETLKTYLSLQDIRTWGDVNQLNSKDVNGFGVHEAWGEIKFSDLLSLKIGRQEVSYDDQRIFGAVGWAQQARSHDGALLKFLFNDAHKMDVGLAYNAMGQSLFKVDYINGNYKTIQWIHYQGKLSKAGLSLLFLNNGLAYDSDPDPATYDEKVSFSQTMGARYNTTIEKIKVDGTFYYQGGKNGMNRDLSALYFSANASFQATEVVNVGAGIEYLSGTSSVDQGQNDEVDHSFTPFYGTNHKFNGWMDYFYVGNYNGQNGLIDIHVPLMFKVNKWSFGIRPHYFLAAATVSTLDQNNQSTRDYNNGLGSEIDLTAKYVISEIVDITGGYSQMLASETMQVVKYPGNSGSEFYKNNNSWAWIMITMKPTFFSKE